MAPNFIECDREQAFLMPPSLRDWVPEDHLVWTILGAVEKMDLSGFYADYRSDGHGRPAYDPKMMVALLLYAYAKGNRSSRGIERECQEDVAYRVICANHVPTTRRSPSFVDIRRPTRTVPTWKWLPAGSAQFRDPASGRQFCSHPTPSPLSPRDCLSCPTRPVFRRAACRPLACGQAQRRVQYFLRELQSCGAWSDRPRICAVFRPKVGKVRLHSGLLSASLARGRLS
jgi:hypothetical protein